MSSVSEIHVAPATEHHQDNWVRTFQTDTDEEKESKDRANVEDDQENMSNERCAEDRRGDTTGDGPERHSLIVDLEQKGTTETQLQQRKSLENKMHQMEIQAEEAAIEESDLGPITPPKLTYWEIFVLFLQFGILAWGGPVAQIGQLKERLVINEKWITIKRFNRVFAVYQVLPGPEAAELCCYFGMLAGGRIGALLGGLGFVLPGFLLMLLLCLAGITNMYFNASFRALQPIVAAMVLRAVHKIADHALAPDHKFEWWLLAIAVSSALNAALHINYFISLGVHGVMYALIARRGRWLRAVGILIFVLSYVAIFLYIGFKGLPSPTSIALGIAPGPVPSMGNIFGLGLVAGAISFGGAYTAVGFVQAEAVVLGQWMTKQQFLDGIALGNVIPAPLVIFSTFVGWQGGSANGARPSEQALLAAVLMTLGMFIPCFSITIIGHNLFERIVDFKPIATFFDGVTASVIGVIAVTAVDLFKSAVTIDVDALNLISNTNDRVAAVNTNTMGLALYLLTLAALYMFPSVRFLTILLVVGGAIAGQILFIS